MIFGSPLDALQVVAHSSSWLEVWNDSDEERDALLRDAPWERVEVPALLVAGRHDGAIPVAVSEAKLARLALPEAEKTLVVLERSGHNSMVEEPDAFAAEVEAFVARHRAR